MRAFGDSSANKYTKSVTFQDNIVRCDLHLRKTNQQWLLIFKYVIFFSIYELNDLCIIKCRFLSSYA